MYAKTGVTVDMGNVACSDDTRKTDEGYKFSMHIFINNVVCSAQSLKHLHSILDLPEWVDVKPYDIHTPDSRRLLRLLGASKTGNSTYMKPCSLLGPNLVHPPPLQDYIITYHDGNEVDITETLVDPDDRPTSRPRRAGNDVALPVREAARQLVGASFLKDFTDDGLAHMASKCMEQYKLDSQHPHSKLRGNRIYYECGPVGRKCIHGAQHKHNRVNVEVRRSREIFFTCFSHKCKNPLRIGF